MHNKNEEKDNILNNGNCTTETSPNFSRTSLSSQNDVDKLDLSKNIKENIPIKRDIIVCKYCNVQYIEDTIHKDKIIDKLKGDIVILQANNDHLIEKINEKSNSIGKLEAEILDLKALFLKTDEEYKDQLKENQKTNTQGAPSKVLTLLNNHYLYADELKQLEDFSGIRDHIIKEHDKVTDEDDDANKLPPISLFRQGAEIEENPYAKSKLAELVVDLYMGSEASQKRIMHDSDHIDKLRGDNFIATVKEWIVKKYTEENPLLQKIHGGDKTRNNYFIRQLTDTSLFWLNDTGGKKFLELIINPLIGSFKVDLNGYRDYLSFDVDENGSVLTQAAHECAINRILIIDRIFKEIEKGNIQNQILSSLRDDFNLDVKEHSLKLNHNIKLITNT